jgi:hypothetical protein
MEWWEGSSKMYADGTGRRNHRKQGVREKAAVAISRNQERGVVFRFVVWAGMIDNFIARPSNLESLMATIGGKIPLSWDRPAKARDNQPALKTMLAFTWCGGLCSALPASFLTLLPCG